MRKFRNYKEDLFKDLKDPEFAAAYLNAALEGDDPTVFLIALKDIADANGGVAKLANQADLNRENLFT
jgi:DNA-binding phage protein